MGIDYVRKQIEEKLIQNWQKEPKCLQKVKHLKKRFNQKPYIVEWQTTKKQKTKKNKQTTVNKTQIN